MELRRVFKTKSGLARRRAHQNKSALTILSGGRANRLRRRRGFHHRSCGRRRSSGSCRHRSSGNRHPRRNCGSRPSRNVTEPSRNARGPSRNARAPNSCAAESSRRGLHTDTAGWLRSRNYARAGCRHGLSRWPTPDGRSVRCSRCAPIPSRSLPVRGRDRWRCPAQTSFACRNSRPNCACSIVACPEPVRAAASTCRCLPAQRGCCWRTPPFARCGPSLDGPRGRS